MAKKYCITSGSTNFSFEFLYQYGRLTRTTKTIHSYNHIRMCSWAFRKGRQCSRRMLLYSRRRWVAIQAMIIPIAKCWSRWWCGGGGTKWCYWVFNDRRLGWFQWTYTHKWGFKPTFSVTYKKRNVFNITTFIMIFVGLRLDTCLDIL